jgi:hypothetical protein
MRRLFLAALVASCALGVAGCIQIGVTVGNEIPRDRVASIVPGQTTKQEILDWFGAPADFTDGEIFARLVDVGDIAAEDIVALPFSDLLVYEIIDGNGRILITILFNWVNVELERDRLVVFFDENDVVLYYGLTRQREHPHAAKGIVEHPHGPPAPAPEPPAQASEHPPAPEPPPAIDYTVVRGDTLSSISKAHYGDPNQFGRIVDANPALREAPDQLVPGQVLRIPPR